MKSKKIILALFVLFASSVLFANPINLKVGSVCPDNSPWSVEQQRLAEEWSRLTDGNINIKFLSATALGGEKGVIQKMKLARPGQKPPIDGGIFSNVGVYELVPESNVLTLCMPFMFKNQDEIDYVIEKTFPEINKAIENQGFYLLAWFSVGMLYFCTKEEVRTPEKLKSISLSVSGITSPELGRAFQYAGYTTSNVLGDQIISSLKSNTGCGGLYTIPMYAYAAQYSKYAKYILDLPFCPTNAGLCINKDVWDSIPEEYKASLLKSLRKSEEVFLGVQQQTDKKYLDKIVEEGGILTELTPEEKQAFYDSMHGDAERMSKANEIKVINYPFLLEIEGYLNEFRGR